jgi:hypothetical protein
MKYTKHFPETEFKTLKLFIVVNKYGGDIGADIERTFKVGEEMLIYESCHLNSGYEEVENYDLMILDLESVRGLPENSEESCKHAKHFVTDIETVTEWIDEGLIERTKIRDKILVHFCKCGKLMDMIINTIENVDSNGFAFYCRDCGSVLITETSLKKVDGKNKVVEEEKEWFERNEL